MNILIILFRWPDGIVLGNLLASGIWAVPGFIRLEYIARKHHREHMERLSNGIRNP